MEKPLSRIVLLNILFIALLSVSGMLTGALSTVIYYASFVLPVILISAITVKEGSEFYGLSPLPSRKGGELALLSAVPITALIFSVSALSSLLMNFLGFHYGGIDVSGDLFRALILHALLPAFMEEILFRYIPLRILCPYSLKCAIIYSAFFFALSHCNLFVIPYAAVAGILFAMLDIAAKSIAPSILLHLFNNVLSVFYQRNSANPDFLILFLIILGVLSLFFGLIIFLFRKRYKPLFYEIFLDKSKVLFTIPMVLFALATLLIAIASLFLN